MAVDQQLPIRQQPFQKNGVGEQLPPQENAVPVGQVPAKRISSKTLIKRHRAHLKAKADSPDDPRPVKQVIMSEAYPASAESIRDLELIPLSALKLETHHRGQGLIVKAVTPPYRGVGAVSVVVDAEGNGDKLAIYNHGDTSILANLPEGCVVAIKEPYYKCNNDAAHDYMICVDHPSDVVLLRFDDPIIPPALRLNEDEQAALRKTPEQWRTAGDMAFLQGDFPTGAYCYTEALETATEKDTGFKAGVHAKRAGTNLLLGRYDGAKEDALASRTSGPADWRAYFTAAKAAYGLCRYPESKHLFEQAIAEQSKASTKGQDANLQREYERCLARVREEEEGSDAAYDFSAMYASLTPQQVHLDRASFLRRTVVKKSDFHGNGLFAVEPIKAGEIVFIEKATFMPNQYEPVQASAALYATMVRQMYDNPSVAAEVLQLYGGDLDLTRTGKEGQMVDGVPVVDVFLAENIRLKNCFSAPLSTFDDTKPDRYETSTRMAKGLWKHASYLNHSCVPNTMRSFLGDVLISRAVRDIAAGEEVFQQYVPVKADLRARLLELQTGWGFACACPLCEGERLSPPQMHDRRRELLAAAEKLVSKHPPHRFPPDAAVRTVEKLIRQIESLYDQEPPAVFGPGRPRLALVYPTMWLLRAQQCRKQHAKVIQSAIRTLRCFGYIRPPQAEDMDTSSRPDARGAAAIYAQPGAATLHTIHVVSALKLGAEAHRALGNAAEADAYEAAARFGYRIVTGFSEDLSAINEEKQDKEKEE